MIAPYTTWRGLTDRSYTGRHLPEWVNDQSLPDIHKIVELWRRKENQEIPSKNTSMLFAFFAQWFTDSFLRTDLLDRRKNTSNHEIDLCQIYGLREEITDRLRLKKEGKLKFQIINGEIYPPYLFNVDETSTDHWVFAEKEFEDLHPRYALEFIFNGMPEERLKRVFAVGLEHGNSAIGYTILNTIMLREHNRICDLLMKTYPEWNDERLFQTCRNIMIALLIRVVIRDYIGQFSEIEFTFDPSPGMAEKQSWYRTNWISIEFNLLYRWHSMVPETFNVGDKQFKPDEFISNTPLVTEYGLETLITAASKQKTGRIGLKNTPDFFFQPIPMGDDMRSIMERTVDMARQARLRPFNDYLEAFSYPRLSSFEELTDDVELQQELKQLYNNNIDNLEWLVGVFAERHSVNFMQGRLMSRMVSYDAFSHALTNPLMSIYVHNENTFSKIGMEIIVATGSIEDIIKRNVKDSKNVIASFRI
jgi:prostaglandin-endoperoxide synthase 2